GTERWMNKIVLSDDPVAADATCCRLMGFVPERIAHISEGARFLGNLAADRITMLAEPALAPPKPFAVPPNFHYFIEPTTHGPAEGAIQPEIRHDKCVGEPGVFTKSETPESK